MWRAVLNSWALEEHELVLLRQAVAVVDVCDELEGIVRREGPLLGDRAHPALVESRQQRQLLARLIVALRVPLGEVEEATRTQFRGLRGVYQPRGVA